CRAVVNLSFTTNVCPMYFGPDAGLTLQLLAGTATRESMLLGDIDWRCEEGKWSDCDSPNSRSAMPK
ncbi:MAG: hypothetical protein K2L41_10060, partial [Muribaculaceae bacterium]|nr:hypothetical protein [Muribaculaceae bacterium]